MLNSPAECARFVESQEPAVIAKYLRRDQELCKEHRLPSLLAWHLPPASSKLGDAISIHLSPDKALHDSSFKKVRHLQYDSVVGSIKAYLTQMDHDARDGPKANGESSHLSTIPSTNEFQSALKVLEYLHTQTSLTGLTSTSTFTEVLAAVRTQLSLDPELRAELKSTAQNKASGKYAKRTRRCYICRFVLYDHHDLYPSLCRSCGSFNLAASELSLPHNLDLSGITALVTGGRINLGFHTALRLLRCGARVIVSTRYPRDAETRYQEQAGSNDWSDRLKIVGADFRSARDAFRLVSIVRKVLSDWRADGSKFAGLNVLINNAAQTLTDPVRLESAAVDREERLQGQQQSGKLLVENDAGYEARVRGGMQFSWANALDGQKQFLLEDLPGSKASNDVDHGNPPQKGLRTEVAKREENKKSSWAQSMDEIPYEDMISAHSVNAFVPLILCRELLPLMAAAGPLPLQSSQQSTEAQSDTSPKQLKSAPPKGYIINVSSREGIFEETPTNNNKAGMHVHTNMSKAAINMITETESARAWDLCGIAMNTVDPGYMSAAPESQRDGEDCPIGFEDGAARVLWPVAVGVKDGVAVKGRFLKHFGETRIEVGLGRGNS